MKILIIGSTGMLGQALCHEAGLRSFQITGIARSNSDLSLDIASIASFEHVLESVLPDVVINTAAITSLALCEQNPANAYSVNARPVAIIADACARQGVYFVQISTDHYYVNDGDARHSETAPIHLVNEYARSKFAGEAFALTCPGALAVRTNIVGFRLRGQPTFVEWAIDALRSSERLTLFNDFYTSSIHVKAFVKALFDLLPLKPSGILNLAAKDVCSKKVFVEMLAGSLGLSTAAAVSGSVTSLTDARRADSLGLDVARAEQLLGHDLPTTHQVVDSLADEYRRIAR